MKIFKKTSKNSLFETPSFIQLYVNEVGKIVYKNKHGFEIVISNTSNSSNPDSYSEKVIDVSSYEMLDLVFFPIEILPALDSNSYYDILNITMEYKGGSAPYSLGSAALISFKYQGGTTYGKINVDPFGDIFNSSWIISNGPTYPMSTSLITYSIPVGEKLVMRTETYEGFPTNFVSGDGSVRITVKYKVKNFTL